MNGLLTDSYQLAMIQSYLDHGLTASAVFEFFVRELPRNRNFLVAAGLEQVIRYLEELRFTPEEIDWLRASDNYGEELIQYLAHFRFTGEVWAMPEGTPFFENEPILRVKAPLPEAQLVETRLINLLQFQTLVASKAARSVIAGRSKFLVDFGLRRAHGAEAGLFASRASYLAGFHATSNVLAGKLFEIPVSGTMAHSFVEVHDNESLAFENFAGSNPDNIVFLIDTYDTVRAAKKVAHLAPQLEKRGLKIRGVRLDSGDLLALSREVRSIFDEAGLESITLFASGNMDEHKIDELIGAGAPIDGFGVGTHMTTSEDAPFLDCAYKLEEYAGVPRRKRSTKKSTLPGAKQVFRFYDENGMPVRDVVGLDSEELDGSPLLECFMRNGQLLLPYPALPELRARCLAHVSRLPDASKSLAPGRRFPVEISPGLRELARAMERAYEQSAA